MPGQERSAHLLALEIESEQCIELGPVTFEGSADPLPFLRAQIESDPFEEHSEIGFVHSGQLRRAVRSPWAS